MQVNYGLLDDSPAKVEAVIGKHNELMQRRATSPTPEVYNRQYAELLLEQADALLRWRSLAEAERLATDASRLDVNYGPFETKPDDLLKRIAAAKNGAPPAGSARPMPAARPLADRCRAANTAPPSPAAKQQALALVGRARQALAAGRFPGGRDAGPPGGRAARARYRFGPQEDRPSMVLLDLTRGPHERRAAGRRTASRPGAGRRQSGASTIRPPIRRATCRPPASGDAAAAGRFQSADRPAGSPIRDPSRRSTVRAPRACRRGWTTWPASKPC